MPPSQITVQEVKALFNLQREQWIQIMDRVKAFLRSLHVYDHLDFLGNETFVYGVIYEFIRALGARDLGAGVAWSIPNPGDIGNPNPDTGEVMSDSYKNQYAYGLYHIVLTACKTSCNLPVYV